MPEEQMKSFLEKVQSNTELQEKLKKAVSIEAVIEIAREEGFAITADDIKSEDDSELSLDELGAVAGGWMAPAATNLKSLVRTGWVNTDTTKSNKKTIKSGHIPERPGWTIEGN